MGIVDYPHDWSLNDALSAVVARLCCSAYAGESRAQAPEAIELGRNLAFAAVWSATGLGVALLLIELVHLLA